MRVEREIAAFAFPFAAGVFAAVILGASPCNIRPTYPTIALTSVIMSAVLLMHPSRHRWDGRAQWVIVGLCAAACGIFIGLSGLETSVSEMTPDGPLCRWAQIAGNGLKSVIEQIPFENSSTNGVIKALLTGDRTGIPHDTAKAFRDSGASHILALSGLHLGIIYALISKALASFGNSHPMRQARSILTIMACGLYTLGTGAGASITRAFIFITVNETARMMGRHTCLKSILATSLILHLALSPTSATEVGFQLSYAAILGIAFIYPHLKNIWKNDWRGLKWIWQSAALSISCQLTTGPLAYHYFGIFPQHFLLTNLLAIPLAGIIIPAALLTAALSSTGCCPQIMMKFTEMLTRTMTGVLSTIASM